MQSGEISDGSVPRLLNAYYQARHRGELKLSQGTTVKVVYFERGRPVYAASNVASERFGRFSVKKGAIAEAALAQVVSVTQKEGLRTGDAMVKLGLINAAKRRELLIEQIKEIIWSTAAWTVGHYTFVARRPNRPDMVKLEVFPGDLILEGVMRKETLISLRNKVPATRRLVPTADPPYGLEEIKLSGPQAVLVANSDGSKTVADLLELSELSERDALATLHGLTLLGLLEERRANDKQRRITFGL
jgi:hypothetical protein